MNITVYIHDPSLYTILQFSSLVFVKFLNGSFCHIVFASTDISFNKPRSSFKKSQVVWNVWGATIVELLNHHTVPKIPNG